jgi:hypothetical protein
MKKELEERIKTVVKVELELQRELSTAISSVLKKYNISGEYMFNVYRSADYCQERITKIKGLELIFPAYCIGCGITSVEEPNKIHPI